MKKILFLFLISAFLFFYSCEEDVKVEGPYKETTIVYGVLKPDTNIQVIRINKSFMGEGNSLVMAQVRDSVNYKPGELDVTLQKMKKGVPASPAVTLRES